jgi:2-C-methyl-D-erythritol 4-phosphate cytidylyltransferase / 2-C-methyl-D-erythritol 2,4-cyclodiphosphate synthase
MQQSAEEIRFMNAAALIVAAGRGERAGGAMPKQYSMLAGKPVLAWSVEAMAEAGIDDTLVVIDPEHASLCRAAIGERPGVRIVAGGVTRSASVQAGLEAVNSALVLIHDAARPGLTPKLVRALIDVLEAGADAAAPALPVADSLRRVGRGGEAGGEVDRADLMRIQTPQAFRTQRIREAYAAAPAKAVFTDDLSVAHANGVRATLIQGEARLLKLTYPDDRVVLEALMGGGRAPSVGTGFDAHRFGDGDHVTLCGVRVAHDKGLVGHSDADAGWHALVDAILGALGEGDIGAHFPPSDPQWRGAASEAFLRHAVARAERAGARVVHVDITLICERPKIGPYREAMRTRTAEVLGLPLHRVSVKATTTERMGFTGREEGLAAQAVATLERPI